MARIILTQLSDDNDCETCGWNYAEGFHVTIDGVPFGDFEPSSSCLDSTSYGPEDVYRALLEYFGHDVKVRNA